MQTCTKEAICRSGKNYIRMKKPGTFSLETHVAAQRPRPNIKVTSEHFVDIKRNVSRCQKLVSNFLRYNVVEIGSHNVDLHRLSIPYFR